MTGEYPVGAMVIEELHFTVEPAERDRFVEVESEIWTSFLRTCDGFVRKEVWYPHDDAATVVVMIWWESLVRWKSITEAQCAEVDRRMGAWLRPITFARAHEVVWAGA